MKLFNRSNDETPAEPLPTPVSLPEAPEIVPDYYQAAQPKQTSRNILLWSGAAVLAVLLVIGLFFGGRTIYRSFHDQKTATTTTAPKTNSVPATPKTPTAPKSNNSTTTPTPSTIPTTNAPSATSGNTATGNSNVPTSNSTTSPSALTDTGPGSTIALFVLASLVGAGLYELRLHRQTH